MEPIKNRKVITHQDFPTIQGGKNLTEKQKDEIMESHEFISGGNIIINESSELGETLLG